MPKLNGFSKWTRKVDGLPEPIPFPEHKGEKYIVSDRSVPYDDREEIMRVLREMRRVAGRSPRPPRPDPPRPEPVPTWGRAARSYHEMVASTRPSRAGPISNHWADDEGWG